jgi:hypothetical protein
LRVKWGVVTSVQGGPPWAGGVRGDWKVAQERRRAGREAGRMGAFILDRSGGTGTGASSSSDFPAASAGSTLYTDLIGQRATDVAGKTLAVGRIAERDLRLLRLTPSGMDSVRSRIGRRGLLVLSLRGRSEIECCRCIDANRQTAASPQKTYRLWTEPIGANTLTPILDGRRKFSVKFDRLFVLTNSP